MYITLSPVCGGGCFTRNLSEREENQFGAAVSGRQEALLGSSQSALPLIVHPTAECVSSSFLSQCTSWAAALFPGFSPGLRFLTETPEGTDEWAEVRLQRPLYTAWSLQQHVKHQHVPPAYTKETKVHITSSWQTPACCTPRSPTQSLFNVLLYDSIADGLIPV